MDIVELEINLFNLIKELHQDIISMTPTGGFSSPRDIELVTQVNIKNAILNKLQEAMQIINPNFDIKEPQ